MPADALIEEAATAKRAGREVEGRCRTPLPQRNVEKHDPDRRHRLGGERRDRSSPGRRGHKFRQPALGCNRTEEHQAGLEVSRR